MALPAVRHRALEIRPLPAGVRGPAFLSPSRRQPPLHSPRGLAKHPTRKDCQRRKHTDHADHPHLTEPPAHLHRETGGNDTGHPPGAALLQGRNPGPLCLACPLWRQCRGIGRGGLAVLCPSLLRTFLGRSRHLGRTPQRAFSHTSRQGTRSLVAQAEPGVATPPGARRPQPIGLRPGPGRTFAGCPASPSPHRAPPGGPPGLRTSRPDHHLHPRQGTATTAGGPGRTT